MNFPFSFIKIQYELFIFVNQNSIWTFHFQISKFNMNFSFSCIKLNSKCTFYFRVSKFNMNCPFSCIKIQYDLSILVLSKFNMNFSIFVYQNSKPNMNLHFHLSKFNMNFPLSCIKIQNELSIFEYQNSIKTFHTHRHKFWLFFLQF